MKKYKKYPFSVKIIEYGKDDFEYEVRFIDFPNVIGVGDTANEAIDEGYYNLQAYIKYCELNNVNIPNPSISREPNDFSGKITIRIPKTLHRDLSEYAEFDGMSLNTIAIDAFRFYLNSQSLSKITKNTQAKIDSSIENAKIKTEEIIRYNYKKSEFVDDDYNAQSSCVGGIGGLSYVC